MYYHYGADLLCIIKLLPVLVAIASSSLPASDSFEFYFDRRLPPFFYFYINCRLPPPEKVRQSFPHPVGRNLGLGEGLVLSEVCWSA